MLSRPNFLDNYILLPYRGKLSREKNFREFRGFVAICESFLHEILGRGVILWLQQAIRKVFFPRKSYFPPICESFLLRKFPTIQWWFIEYWQNTELSKPSSCEISSSPLTLLLLLLPMSCNPEGSLQVYSEEGGVSVHHLYEGSTGGGQPGVGEVLHG